MHSLDAIKSRCQIDPDDDCWTWTGATWSGKYPLPKLNVGRRTVYVRPLVFALAKGRDRKPGTVIAMRCGNSKCLNPAHMREAKVGSLGPRGKRPVHQVVRGTLGRRKAGMYRLDMDRARAIRERVQAGESVTAIAADLGVHRNTVWEAATQRTWAEVTPWRI